MELKKILCCVRERNKREVEKNVVDKKTKYKEAGQIQPLFEENSGSQLIIGVVIYCTLFFSDRNYRDSSRTYFSSEVVGLQQISYWL